MKIFIDADGCPVVDIVLRLAAQAGLKAVIVCDTAHEFHRDGVETITVSQGADSVDFALVNRLKEGDIAVTQDYGCCLLYTSLIRVEQTGAACHTGAHSCFFNRLMDRGETS